MDMDTFSLLESFINLKIDDFNIDNLDSQGKTLSTLTQIKIMLEGFPLQKIDSLFNEMKVVPSLINGLSSSQMYNDFKSIQLTKENYRMILPEKAQKGYYEDNENEDYEEDEDDEIYDEHGLNEEKFQIFVKMEIYHLLSHFLSSKLLATEIIKKNGIEIMINLLNEPKVEIKNMMLFNLYRLLDLKEAQRSIIENIDLLGQHFELILQHEDALRYGKGCLVVNILNIVLGLSKLKENEEKFKSFFPRLFKYFDKYLMMSIEEIEVLFDICQTLYGIADNYPLIFNEFIQSFGKSSVKKLIELFDHPVKTVVSWVIISLERILKNSSQELFDSFELNENELLFSKMKSFFNVPELKLTIFLLLITLFQCSVDKEDSPLIAKFLEESSLLSQYVEIIRKNSDLSNLSPQAKQINQIIVYQLITIIKILNQKDKLNLLSTMKIIPTFAAFLNDSILKTPIIEMFEDLIELNNQDIISLFKINDIHIKIIQLQPDNSILNKLK